MGTRKGMDRAPANALFRCMSTDAVRATPRCAPRLDILFRPYRTDQGDGPGAACDPSISSPLVQSSPDCTSSGTARWKPLRAALFHGYRIAVRHDGQWQASPGSVCLSKCGRKSMRGGATKIVPLISFRASSPRHSREHAMNAPYITGRSTRSLQFAQVCRFDIAIS